MRKSVYGSYSAADSTCFCPISRKVEQKDPKIFFCDLMRKDILEEFYVLYETVYILYLYGEEVYII